MMGNVHEKRFRDGSIRQVTAICDRIHLGKVFKEGVRILDMKTYRRFYEGKVITEVQACQMFKEARNINAVGEKAVACALKALPIDPESVITIQGVPHIQVYYL
jgi:uncharacterized protein